MEYDYDKDGPLMSRRCLFTNADRIRAMSDEELAELFESWIQDCGCNAVPCLEPCKENIKKYGDKSCQECWLDWLRQEASDG